MRTIVARGPKRGPPGSQSLCTTPSPRTAQHRDAALDDRASYYAIAANVRLHNHRTCNVKLLRNRWILRFDLVDQISFHHHGSARRMRRGCESWQRLRVVTCDELVDPRLIPISGDVDTRRLHRARVAGSGSRMQRNQSVTIHNKGMNGWAAGMSNACLLSRWRLDRRFPSDHDARWRASARR